jgi:hypothetical protein
LGYILGDFFTSSSGHPDSDTSLSGERVLLKEPSSVEAELLYKEPASAEDELLRFEASLPLSSCPTFEKKKLGAKFAKIVGGENVQLCSILSRSLLKRSSDMHRGVN